MGMELSGVMPCFSTATSSLFTNSGSGRVPGKSWSIVFLNAKVVMHRMPMALGATGSARRERPGEKREMREENKRMPPNPDNITKTRRLSMDQLFPGTLPEPEFVKRLLGAVEKHGLTPANTIPIVGTCRDALASPLYEEFKRVFPGYFNIVSLAGLPQLGTIGLRAGLGHSPLDKNGKERYLVLSLTHIGIDENGEAGKFKRPGREPTSSQVCGALCALHSQIQNEDYSTEIVDDNNEFYKLKEAVLQDGTLKRKGKEVDIVELTKHTLDVTTETVSKMMERAVDKEACASYAVCTGMQIHEVSHLSSLLRYLIFCVL
mmetsp:Transcript_45830/g.118463  ORF Transcript_45830/g.118463 Transcript_45830/m.118463 type:complete len:319 (-) Transcript_45830:130-1086(-)